MTKNEELEEVKDHPFKNFPLLLLEKYPGVRQILEQSLKIEKNFGPWRKEETLIQYGNWTCNLLFSWTLTTTGKIEVDKVRLFKICKAPPEADQYELL